MTSKKSCRKGTILRKAYTRRVKSKKIHVRSGCIRAQSQSGKKRVTVDMAIMSKRRKVHSAMRKKFGTPKCRKGQIVREGYILTRKTGVKTKVAPGCIKATGLSKKRGKKGKQLFVLEKGSLTQYGYHANLEEKERHMALKRAVGIIKPLSVYRKLNAIYVLNKNRNPKMAILYKGDAEWVKTTPEYKERV